MESLTGLRTTGRSSITTRRLSLPTEIWRLIFSVGESDVDDNFWSAYDHATLASICLCCTMFRDLIRPRLYYNFDSHVFTDKWRWFSVGKFARTVCTNPHLSSMVRRVDIRGVCDMDQMCGALSVISTDNPDHPMASVLIPRAAELGMDFKYHKLYSEKLSGNEISGFIGLDLVALVLAQLPMMHTLQLFWFDFPDIPPISQPRGGWPWAHSLRNMVLRPCNSPNPIGHYKLGQQPEPTRGYSFSSVLPLLYGGGGLTRLSLLNSIGPHFVLPLGNLREAILESCQFSPGSLVNLLQHCKHLRKFVYRGSWHPTLLPSPEFIEALEPAHTSLEVLGIDLQSFDNGNQSRIASLKQFTALKTLYIDFNCVWTWEVATNKHSPPNPDMLFTTLLPESIEEVALFSGDTNDVFLGFMIEAHVKGLASERKEKGALPHLKRLRGRGLSPLDTSLDDEAEAMRRMAILDEATRQLGDYGVEVVFDEEGKSDLEFGDIIPHF